MLTKWGNFDKHVDYITLPGQRFRNPVKSCVCYFERGASNELPDDKQTLFIEKFK